MYKQFYQGALLILNTSWSDADHFICLERLKLCSVPLFIFPSMAKPWRHWMSCMMFSTGRKHDAHLQNRDERLDITVSGCQKDQRAPCGLQETAGHTPIYMEGTEVERVRYFRLLVINISEDLSCRHHKCDHKSNETAVLPSVAAKEVGMDRRILANFCRCTIKSIPSDYIMTW